MTLSRYPVSLQLLDLSSATAPVARMFDRQLSFIAQRVIMHKATEHTYFDAETGTVIVECIKPDGGTLNVQINSDAAEAIVLSFNDAKPTPPLGLEDSGVYKVCDVELIAATEGLLLDLWVVDGRKVRFVLPVSNHSQHEIDAFSKELRRLLNHQKPTYSRH